MLNQQECAGITDEMLITTTKYAESVWIKYIEMHHNNRIYVWECMVWRQMTKYIKNKEQGV